MSKKQVPPAMSLENAYNALIADGRIKDDAAQRQAIAHLQALSDTLGAQSTSLLRKLKRARSPIRGLYIWGNVGRGKSMLMDLFYTQINVTHKRRIHFHAFMQEIHARMHQFRQEQRDPVASLIEALSQEVRLLCFDELQATDVTDASLLFRLFSGLFASGVTIVSTSNHPPSSLYTGGVQRERFNKFIHLIEEQMKILPLTSPHDYRKEQVQSLKQMYFYPLNAATDAGMADLIARLSDSATPARETLTIQGRAITLTRCNEDTALASFPELCAKPLGAADYLAIAQRFGALILTDIPRLTPENRNEAKRFVTLIDVLYEQKTQLICSAEVPADQLYVEGDGAFEFGRTVSRLTEMSSTRYLAGTGVKSGT